MGLLDMFGGRPTPQMLGTGMAQQAAQVMKSRPYQLWAQEQQMQGKPVNVEEFMRMMNAQQGMGASPQPAGLLGR